MANGFMQRFKGKVLVPAGSLSIFGSGAAIGGPQGNIFTFGGSVGNGADTTEDTLATYSMPANTLNAIGRGLFIYAWGSMTAVANKTGKLYFGASTVSTGLISATSESWSLEMVVLKSAANVQQISAQLINAATHGGVTNSAGSETDTAAIVIKVTGQNSASTANGIVCNGLIVTAFD